MLVYNVNRLHYLYICKLNTFFIVREEGSVSFYSPIMFCNYLVKVITEHGKYYHYVSVCLSPSLSLAFPPSLPYYDNTTMVIDKDIPVPLHVYPYLSPEPLSYSLFHLSWNWSQNTSIPKCKR